MSTYTFIGEVIGSTALSGLDVKLVDTIDHRFGGYQIKLDMILNVTGHQIVILVNNVPDDTDPMLIASLIGAVQSRAAFSLDLIGLELGYPLGSNITHILDPQSDLIPIFLVDHQKFSPIPLSYHEMALFNTTKMWVATTKGQVLENLRLSMTNNGSAMYAYRAIESIRQHFKAAAPNGDQSEPKFADSDSWKAIRNALNFERSYINDLVELATASRHGEALDLTFPQRMQLIDKTRQIVARYLIFVQRGKISLDIKEFPMLK